MALLLQCLALGHLTTTTRVPERVLQAGTPASVALAIAGQPRALLGKKVVSSFQEFVPSGDVHMVIVTNDSFTASDRVREIYNPVKMRTISSLRAASFNLTCEPIDHRVTPQDSTSLGRRFVLMMSSRLQVYMDVEETEREQGRQYDWVVSLRTDLVFFEPLSLSGLDPTLVHLPNGGMSSFSISRT